MANMIDYTEKVLQVKHLKKYFRVGSGRRKLNIPAVDDVTLDVYKREVFGVVAESGWGSGLRPDNTEASIGHAPQSRGWSPRQAVRRR